MIHAYKLQHMFDGSQAQLSSSVQSSDDNIVPNPKFEDWKTIDQKLFNYLFYAVTKRILPYISHATSFKEVWLLLEWKYVLLSRSNISQIKNRLQNMKKGTQSMSNYLQQVKTCTYILASVCAPMNEEDVILHVLNGLPSDFYTINTTVRL